jgi:hypothetical protein
MIICFLLDGFPITISCKSFVTTVVGGAMEPGCNGVPIKWMGFPLKFTVALIHSPCLIYDHNINNCAKLFNTFFLNDLN